MNGHHQNMRIAAPGSANGQKADPANPIARKLVYNAYREMLSKKHADANVIVDNAPQELVTEDQGIGARVESMMRQQSELKGGNMHAGGPPPPPPPPPIPGIIPASRLPSELSSQVSTMNQPPAALASAMMKERKPFTYTPGGLDLSEISNQPNQNGNGVDQADFGVPFQSRSFRVLQTVLDHQDTAEPQGPVHIPSMRQNVQQPSQQQPQPNQFQQQPVYQQHSGSYQQPGVNNAASVEQTAPEPKKYMGGNIPSRSFRMLQAMTASDDVAGPGQSDL